MSVKKKAFEHISKRLGMESIVVFDPELLLEDDLGVDSITLQEILMDLEDYYGMEFVSYEYSKFSSIKTVQDLINYVEIRRDGVLSA